ncbi:autophagy-related protein 27 [Limtongia smithiae]|uniref:autophagy-related protein 27 n=1 Tax=Limtongia smithiae TaxID=1125753 RepID=UPI0034CFABB3
MLVPKSSAVLLAALVASASAAVFDCTPTIDGTRYDLSSLAGPHVIRTARDTPPTTTFTNFTFDLCAALENNNIAEELQCAQGTQVCVVQSAEFVSAAGANEHIVTQVIPVATVKGDSSAYKLGEDVVVHLTGGSWGSVDDLSVDVVLSCDAAATSAVADAEVVISAATGIGSDVEGLEVISWDEKNLKLNWKTAVVCGAAEIVSAEQDVSILQDNNNNNGGSIAYRIIKYILIAVLIAAVVFFLFSAYVNYSKGKTGVDLLPSSEAILEIPYVARDFVRKVGNGFTTNTSRDGYAVF